MKLFSKVMGLTLATFFIAVAAQAGGQAPQKAYTCTMIIQTSLGEKRFPGKGNTEKEGREDALRLCVEELPAWDNDLCYKSKDSIDCTTGAARP